MTNPINVFPERIRRGVLADLAAGVSVQTAALNWGVSADIVYAWGRHGRVPRPPKPELPQRRCIGHSEFSADGRCPCWFMPESRFIFRCPNCRAKSAGMAA